VPTIVTSGHRLNSHATCACGYKVCFSVNILAGIMGGILVGPYLLPRQLDAQQLYFSPNIFVGAA
jgi:hypothetical protein